MDNENKLKEAEKELKISDKKLKLLNKYKFILLKDYEIADDEKREKLKIQLKKNEEDYRKLAEEVLVLGNKIKKLKKEI